MRFKAIVRTKNLQFIIDYDEYVGYYLYVNELDTGRSLADHLLDELDDAFEEAEVQYGVTRDMWKEL